VSGLVRAPFRQEPLKHFREAGPRVDRDGPAHRGTVASTFSVMLDFDFGFGLLGKHATPDKAVLAACRTRRPLDHNILISFGFIFPIRNINANEINGLTFKSEAAILDLRDGVEA